MKRQPLALQVELFAPNKVPVAAVSVREQARLSGQRDSFVMLEAAETFPAKPFWKPQEHPHLHLEGRSSLGTNQLRCAEQPFTPAARFASLGEGRKLRRRDQRLADPKLRELPVRRRTRGPTAIPRQTSSFESSLKEPADGRRSSINSERTAQLAREHHGLDQRRAARELLQGKRRERYGKFIGQVHRRDDLQGTAPSMEANDGRCVGIFGRAHKHVHRCAHARSQEQACIANGLRYLSRAPPFGTVAQARLAEGKLLEHIEAETLDLGARKMPLQIGIIGRRACQKPDNGRDTPKLESRYVANHCFHRQSLSLSADRTVRISVGGAWARPT